MGRGRRGQTGAEPEKGMIYNMEKRLNMLDEHTAWNGVYTQYVLQSTETPQKTSMNSKKRGIKVHSIRDSVNSHTLEHWTNKAPSESCVKSWGYCLLKSRSEIIKLIFVFLFLKGKLSSCLTYLKDPERSTASTPLRPRPGTWGRSSTWPRSQSGGWISAATPIKRKSKHEATTWSPLPEREDRAAYSKMWQNKLAV